MSGLKALFNLELQDFLLLLTFWPLMAYSTEKIHGDSVTAVHLRAKVWVGVDGKELVAKGEPPCESVSCSR